MIISVLLGLPYELYVSLDQSQIIKLHHSSIPLFILLTIFQLFTRIHNLRIYGTKTLHTSVKMYVCVCCVCVPT